ncbi:MAG: tRNA-binding protein [Alphaproteobacteria bacterium]|nr:tRNA-binding protein [Alphaproteobacteria bacterium]
MNIIPFADFESVELLAGTITRAEPNERAIKPAYKVWADFGELGIKQSSVQITHHYTCEELVGKQIMGCMNLGERNIAGFKSEFLLCGFPDAEGKVVIVSPTRAVPNGAKLF